MVKGNKGAILKNTTVTNVLQLSAWDGKKVTYPDFRKEVTKLSTQTGINWIINAGRALFNKMQKLQEGLKKKNKTFKATFDAHEASVWAEALQARENGCVEAQLAVVRVDTLKQCFGSNFTEFAKCGFTDETKHADAIDNALEQKLLEMNITLLSALTEAVFSNTKDTSHSKDCLRRILLTAEIRSLLDGGAAKGVDTWYENPQNMPAVKAWFEILWKYEGMNENIDSAFVEDFNEIAASGIGPKPENINEINSKLELHMEAAEKAFSTVKEICDHMRHCALVKIIKKWARGDTRQAAAWKLADDAIVAATRTNTMLNTTAVNNAIALAQRHLDRDDDDEDDATTLTSTTQTAEMEALKKQLEDAQKSIKALKAEVSQPGKRKRFGEGGKEGGGGGKGGKPEWKTCSTCNGKHFGNPPEKFCFEQPLEQQLQHIQSLIKKKKA
eukprot:CAMPEP_0181328118 /NCGR_PEP_ID=MMETSP1101-20121128/22511_1 /TAXON_ID=46948 /ORGANISM="Rhodomonas abbreviata, Strain Caron Lab Isolate" /LENGTH=442 /DNA_ID=CAMNT_0023436917 /DNA_START=164 /DNA_END=1488 /DNA_ORIENTATION=-